MSPHTFDDFQKLKEEVKKEVMSEVELQLKAIMRGQDEINRTIFATNQRLEQIAKDIVPVIKWFNDYNGFKAIGITWLKTLGLIGSAILGLYAIIEFLKKIGKQ